MGGTSCGTGTTLARLTTTWVAKPETPRWWYTGRAAPAEPDTATEQCAGLVGRAARFARRPTVGRARRALAATRKEHQHDSLTDRDPVDAVADLLDDSSGFMTEQDRHRPYPGAVDHRQVGVAHARSLDSDKDLTAVGRVQVQLDDADWFRPPIGPRHTDLV